MSMSTVLFWITVTAMVGFLVGCGIAQYSSRNRRRRRGKPLVWRMLARQWARQQGNHHYWEK